MSIFYLNGSNDLATVPISAIYIRLLVKQLFSFAKIQQFVGYTKKSMFFNDRGRQGLFKSFQKALKEPFNEPFNELSMSFSKHVLFCSSMSYSCEEMYKYAKGEGRNE